MAKYCDSLAVIFPFEVDCFKDTDLDVHFVGHPFVQEGHECGLRYEEGGDVLLLPGSRVAPVKRILPVMLKAFLLYKKRDPKARAKIVCASQKLDGVIRGILSKYEGQLGGSVECVWKEENVSAGVVLTSSGTMSLRVALAGIPGALVYVAHPITYWVGRLVVDIDRLGMPNILLKRFAYPEYIQGDAKAKKLAQEIEACVEGSERVSQMQADCEDLKEALGQAGTLGSGQWLESFVKKR